MQSMKYVGFDGRIRAAFSPSSVFVLTRFCALATVGVGAAGAGGAAVATSCGGWVQSL
jgi:hypothetical protein